MRQFRHIVGNSDNVRRNPSLQFALRHTMQIYPSNAVYTMIPKNGCSSLRYSVAVANGCVSGPDNLNWIHNNNETFNCDLESAFKSEYTFVVLRCPYRRLLSAFYDKIANIDVESWELYNLTDRRIHPHDMNFARFLDTIASLPRSKWNIHWRPQSDFLLFQRYDGVFAVEDFDAMAAAVQERIGLEVIDTRPLLRHEREASELDKKEDRDASHYPALRLLNMKRQGTIYSDKSFYSPGVIEKVNRLYEDDIRLYRSAGFGTHCLIQR